MPHSLPARITDQGQRVRLRLQGCFCELSQQELRSFRGLPAGSPGLGIRIEGDRLRSAFAADHQALELAAGPLPRRLADDS